MRTYDDFETGQVFELGEHQMTEQEILDFARVYDPQSFHIDKEAAKKTMYGGLIGSGWQTASIYMSLLVRAVVGDSTSQGSAGIDELRWLKPVRPGDVLRGRMTVTAKKPSERHPERGTIFTLGELFNQTGERVFFVRSSGIFGRKS
ncbi:MAG TPA: MaoC family dehydratase [Myxococcales bacterium]|jgi:acyl dehydratase|nr:MaoC family dehydratase [Myxococcales bacterium]